MKCRYIYNSSKEDICNNLQKELVAKQQTNQF